MPDGPPVLSRRGPDPAEPGQISKGATTDGENKAGTHYPDAVIEDHKELRAFAEAEATAKYHTYSGYQKTIDLETFQHIYVSPFMGAYLAQVKFKDATTGTRRRTEAKLTDGASVSIVNVRRYMDGNVYELELNDDEYLKEPVRAEIVVRNDGEAEVREDNSSD